jgi:hypothetical protein
MTIRNTFLSTTVGNICVSTNATTAITSMYFCNTGSNMESFTVFVVPQGETQSPVHTIYEAVQVAAHDTYIVEAEKLLLSDGDTIQAVATTANVIAATVSYMGL